MNFMFPNQIMPYISNSCLILYLAMQQKNTRRNKKDHKSRDFTCKCGLSYLSYPAVYTHVKNKHPHQQDYFNDIEKPKREKKTRGRPKQKKQKNSSIEIEELSILEEAILKIYNKLEAVFNKIILEGNQSLKPQEFEQQFLSVNQEFGHKNHKLEKIRSDDRHQRFTKDLTRHFTGQIAGRVKFTVKRIQQIRNQAHQQGDANWQKIEQQLSKIDIWKGVNEINNLICETLRKWQKVSQQANN